jgi:hypothetical protein
MIAGFFPSRVAVDGEMAAAPLAFAVVESIRPAAPALVFAVVLPRAVVGDCEATPLTRAGVLLILSQPFAFIQAAAGVQSDARCTGDCRSGGRCSLGSCTAAVRRCACRCRWRTGRLRFGCPVAAACQGTGEHSAERRGRELVKAASTQFWPMLFVVTHTGIPRFAIVQATVIFETRAEGVKRGIRPERLPLGGDRREKKESAQKKRGGQKDSPRAYSANNYTYLRKRITRQAACV